MHITCHSLSMVLSNDITKSLPIPSSYARAKVFPLDQHPHVTSLSSSIEFTIPRHFYFGEHTINSNTTSKEGVGYNQGL